MEGAEVVEPPGGPVRLSQDVHWTSVADGRAEILDGRTEHLRPALDLGERPVERVGFTELLVGDDREPQLRQCPRAPLQQ
jgi:hypothetical protein